MEKTIVFLPMIIFGVIFLLLILGFLALVGKLLLNAKKDEWIGTVVDKLHKTNRNENNREEHYYTLVINTDAGRKRNIAVTLDQYNSAKPGDRYQKIPGNLLPKKI
jgi:hypothetical protein